MPSSGHQVRQRRAKLLRQRTNCPTGSAIVLSQLCSMFVHRQNVSGIAKPIRLAVEPRIGDFLGRVVAAVAAEHDERSGLQRQASRHDPADAADHDVGGPHQREQLAHRELAADEVAMRRRQLADQPFLARFDVGHRNHGMASPSARRRCALTYSGNGLRASLRHSRRTVTGRTTAIGRSDLTGDGPMSGRSNSAGSKATPSAAHSALERGDDRHSRQVAAVGDR